MVPSLPSYNDSTHRSLSKPSNEIAPADVQKKTEEKRIHRGERLNNFYTDIQNKTVNILIKKNKLDKGNKIKLDHREHKVVGVEGYNLLIKLFHS